VPVVSTLYPDGNGKTNELSTECAPTLTVETPYT
ncbi:MAG: hypothetical protein RLZZ122_648, partial [Actinomycetota bacterium]